ncbi:hypothetical protein SteCoe_36523 [Stentor coeruleus]|uniref:Uncharacterized protein n=1 Tax=Stentor coeruleus TaxID=5963 RepID=A0A1R2APZ8_9CILI|nr:hypothetical protein SteCoe_36523 [Stentor coeruleus]
MLRFLSLSFVCFLFATPTYAMWSKESCLTTTTIIITTADVVFQKSNPFYVYVIGTGLLWVEKDFWYLFCVSHGPYTLQSVDVEDDKCFDTLMEIDEEIKKILKSGIDACEDEIYDDECVREIFRVKEIVEEKTQRCKRLVSPYQIS